MWNTDKCSYPTCYIGSTFIPKLQGKFLATENFFHTSKVISLSSLRLKLILLVLYFCNSYLLTWRISSERSFPSPSNSSLGWAMELLFPIWWLLVNNFVVRIGQSWLRNSTLWRKRTFFAIASLQHILWPCFMIVSGLLWMIRGINKPKKINK